MRLLKVKVEAPIFYNILYAFFPFKRRRNEEVPMHKPVFINRATKFPLNFDNRDISGLAVG